MNGKRLLVSWGLPVRIAAFQTTSAKFYDKNSSFKSALLIVMFPHRRSIKVALETYPLHLEIIQFNIIMKKRSQLFFSVSSPNGIRDETRYTANKSSSAIYFSLLTFSLPFACKFMEIVLDNNKPKSAC